MKRSPLTRPAPLARTTRPKRTSPLRPVSRTNPRRDWTEARAKVDYEGRCRVCGRSDVKLDAAHIIPRSMVPPDCGGEHPDNIVPLCAERCHPAYDRGELDLLGALSIAEQVKAVDLACGISRALRRITKQHWCPVEERAA